MHCGGLPAFLQGRLQGSGAVGLDTTLAPDDSCSPSARPSRQSAECSQRNPASIPPGTPADRTRGLVVDPSPAHSTLRQANTGEEGKGSSSAAAADPVIQEGMAANPGNDEHKTGEPGHALEEVEEYSMELDSMAQCPLCLKEYEVGRMPYQLPCRHLFHKDCLRKWFTTAVLCCPL